MRRASSCIIVKNYAEYKIRERYLVLKIDVTKHCIFLFTLRIFLRDDKFILQCKFIV